MHRLTKNPVSSQGTVACVLLQVREVHPGHSTSTSLPTMRSSLYSKSFMRQQDIRSIGRYPLRLLAPNLVVLQAKVTCILDKKRYRLYVQLQATFLLC